MSGIGTGYDLSVSTFSPDGKVFQTEYAQKAVDNSGTAIGVRCKDGVVLGVEREVLSKLLVEGSVKRIHTVGKHAGMATAGLAADARQIANRARDEAAEYKSFYGDVIPAQVLCDRVAAYMHLFNLYWYCRPLGASLLLGAWDPEHGPQLYLLEPSGTAHRYFGAAAGKGRQAARTELEKLKMDELSSEQAVKEVARILYGLHDDGKPIELELCWVCEQSNRQFQRVPKELHEEAERLAKAAMEDDMSDD